MKDAKTVKNVDNDSTFIFDTVRYLHAYHTIEVQDVLYFGLPTIFKAYKRYYPNTKAFKLLQLPRSWPPEGYYSLNSLYLKCLPCEQIYCPEDLLVICVDNEGNITLSDEQRQYAERNDKNWFAPIIAQEIPELQKKLLDFCEWYSKLLYEARRERKRRIDNRFATLFEYDLVRNIDYILKLGQLYGVKDILYDLFERNYLNIYEYIQEPSQIHSFITRKLYELRSFICNYEKYREKHSMIVR